MDGRKRHPGAKLLPLAEALSATGLCGMKKNISVPATTEKPELDFVEIPCTAVSKTNIRPLSNAPAAVIRTASFQIEISNDISDTLLSHILREVSHA